MRWSASLPEEDQLPAAAQPTRAGGAAVVTCGAGGGARGVDAIGVAAVAVAAASLVVVVAKAELLLHLPRAGSAPLQSACRKSSSGASVDRQVTNLALGTSAGALSRRSALRTLRQAGAVPAARDIPSCAMRCE